jgi:hypothetical protein
MASLQPSLWLLGASFGLLLCLTPISVAGAHLSAGVVIVLVSTRLDVIA